MCNKAGSFSSFIGHRNPHLPEGGVDDKRDDSSCSSGNDHFYIFFGIICTSLRFKHQNTSVRLNFRQ